MREGPIAVIQVMSLTELEKLRDKEVMQKFIDLMKQTAAAICRDNGCTLLAERAPKFWIVYEGEVTSEGGIPVRLEDIGSVAYRFEFYAEGPEEVWETKGANV